MILGVQNGKNWVYPGSFRKSRKQRTYGMRKWKSV